jgi:protein N-lysine methyltransferase METTL21D
VLLDTDEFDRLALHSLGWNVCATDVEPVLSTVLKPNLAANSAHVSSIPNASTPHILECKELDWTVPIASWKWDQPDSIARHSRGASTEENQPVNKHLNSSKPALKPPYDLIITADTLYTPALITPLLRSLQHLSTLSTLPGAKFSCPLYLAVERRDPQLMDRAFEECSSIWGFKVERIRAAKIKKALERANVSWVEERSLWEGVEIWKMRLPADAEVLGANEQTETT